MNLLHIHVKKVNRNQDRELTWRKRHQERNSFPFVNSDCCPPPVVLLSNSRGRQSLTAVGDHSKQVYDRAAILSPLRLQMQTHSCSHLSILPLPKWIQTLALKYHCWMSNPAAFRWTLQREVFWLVNSVLMRNPSDSCLRLKKGLDQCPPTAVYILCEIL